MAASHQERTCHRLAAAMTLMLLANGVGTISVSAAESPAPDKEAPLRIENAWVREAPPVASVNAGYFSICNDSAVDAVLTGVGSPRFDRIEMHETIEENGTSRMAHLPSVELSAGRCISFEPGGRHLMMFEASERVRAGDTVLLRFEFADLPDVEITAPVRRGDDEPGKHVHH